jgi:signal transduction histidine kinase
MWFWAVSTSVATAFGAGAFLVRRLAFARIARRRERARDPMLSERRYRSIFERSHVALFEQDLDELVEVLMPLHHQFGPGLASHLRTHPEELGALLQRLKTNDVNAAALRFLEKDRETVLSHSRPNVVDPASFADLLQQIGDGRDDGWEGVVTFMTGDGSIKKAICGVTVTRSPHGVRAFTHLTDITDREHTRELLLEAREELARANRALTVGALSMSLAHDLSQPMSAIAIDATVAQRSLGHSPADIIGASRAVDRVIWSARRVADLLHRTREQAARRERTVEPVILAHIIRTSIDLLDHDMALRGCRVVTALGDGQARVAADRIELQQVFINLILNAIAASQQPSADDGEIAIALKSQGAKDVQVEISDGGTGLPAGEEHRIFDPLFSTMPGSMGMGLAICRTIIQRCGGDLMAWNNERGGATFSFTLPVL